MMKKCPICRKLYMSADEDFHRDKTHKDGYKNVCKQCIKDNRTEPVRRQSALNCPVIQKCINEDDLWLQDV